MKVILNEDVRKLGKKGESIEVADGYGRNYLIARGLAREATALALKELKEQNAADQRRDDKKRQEALELQSQLSGKVVRMAVSSGEGGRLFGSVTTAQVAQALKEQYKAKIDKKNIQIDGAVKTLGSWPLTMKLHGGVELSMTLVVEAQ